MVDKPTAGDAGTPPTEAAPRTPSPHRHADPREAVAELTERAQQISREAGGKVAAAMKDVVSAAAGIAGFAIESARDLVQFMVRRGQMTQDEADRLLREVESAHAKRPASERERPTATKVAAERAAAAKAEAAARAAAAQIAPPRPAAKPNVAPASPTKAPPSAAAKPAKAAAPAKASAAKSAPAKAAKKAPAKSAPAKPAAKKAPSKAGAKSAKPAKKPAAKKR